jgi:adenine-specific DNA-methyltransferase
MIYKEFAHMLYQSMGANINIPNDIKDELNKHDAVKYEKYILHKVGSGNINQLSPLSANVGLTDDYNPIFGRRRIRGDLWKGFYSDMMNVAKEADTDFKNGKKPVRLIKQLLQIATLQSDVVLDFFSGSSTTAHAIMQLNAEDGGSRKWIMVQLPESTEESSEAFKAGYKNIPDIARERIRRAGDKIAAEHPDVKVDYGFRSLVVDDSNFKEVYKPVNEYNQVNLFETVDNIKDDRSDYDLLYGVLVQLALELNRPIEIRDINGKSVYLYDYFGEISGLIACFAEGIDESVVKEIAGLKPLTAVFRDSSFADSQAKVNLAEHFRIISPETKIKVI